ASCSGWLCRSCCLGGDVGPVAGDREEGGEHDSRRSSERASNAWSLASSVKPTGGDHLSPIARLSCSQRSRCRCSYSCASLLRYARAPRSPHSDSRSTRVLASKVSHLRPTLVI